MDDLPPVLVGALFPEERAALLTLLAGLSDEQWALPTVCTGWSVHDLALHVLGDDVGFISRRRDRYTRRQLPSDQDLGEWDQLVAYINDLNASWVQALRRMSPPLLCQFLQLSGEALAHCIAELDVMVMGDPVSWAGTNPAPVWLDIAREYTERWIHQQQIRDAVGQAGLQDERYLAPVLATFVYALPQALKDTIATEGTALQLVITGEAGNTWAAVYQGGRWCLTADPSLEPSAQVTITAERAWRLFTKGLTPAEARMAITVTGDQLLGQKVLEMVAIIA